MQKTMVLLLWKALWLHSKEWIWYCELWHLEHYLFWSPPDWPMKPTSTVKAALSDVSLVKSLIQAERSWNDDSEFFSSPFDSIIMSKSLWVQLYLSGGAARSHFSSFACGCGNIQFFSWFFSSFFLSSYLVYKFRVSAFLMIVYNKTHYSFRNALALHHLSRALLN